MADNKICPGCGKSVSMLDSVCPHCGTTIPETKSTGAEPAESSASELYDDPRKAIVRPKTIEELRQYCEVRKMPLERMRFFIGEDYRPPKAFGIYRAGTSFVVYKNKADGSRAVRYHGPDEAYAVKELFEKLLSECHNRNIYPERAFSSSGGADRSADTSDISNQLQRSSKPAIITAIVVVLLFIALIIGICFCSSSKHKNDGYYQDDSGGYYYRYGDYWYYGNDGDWEYVKHFPDSDYEDHFIGSSYDSDWGVSDFKDSEIWENFHNRSDSDSGSDYSDWDSGGTDWDSDW